MKNIKIGQDVYNDVSEIEVDLADNSGTAIFTDGASGGGDDTLTKCLLDKTTECVDPKFPEGVTEIGMYVCYGNQALKGNLTIPNSVTRIGNHAFNYCKGFTGSLTLPNSLTEIGENAFYHCSGFTGSLTLPNSVTNISHSAFAGCRGFNGNLILSSSLVNIDYGAFSGCSNFTGKLIIPSLVTNIDMQAFKDCSGFDTTMRCEAITPPMLADYPLPSQITTVEVPMASVSAYQNAGHVHGSVSAWSDYTIVGY